ncbi:uncharacterized protein DSM5745_05821 [Aspergillus mulundensis]|uniref:F-box domain-containing protein n=1 Tax=Aspergillus mulundensis TaxID=1810919 RepID=A0A3D8RY35_9EURO|nr:hypothetical protein DSM5745_05821 [Aspergillus mulundensis]RDW78969.1 hypothetical protein DSM5745_05821 [Aspergillus mulundensis]
MAQRRDLAALVERICIHPYLLQSVGKGKKISKLHLLWGSNFMQCLAEQESFSENEVQDAFRQLARTLKVRNIMECLSAADLLTALIVILPNLQHCSMQVDPLHGEIVRAAGGNSEDSVRLFDLGQRAGALLAVCPGLETLNIHTCGGVWQMPPLPNLKTLSLTFSQLTAESLERLLSCCTGLRSFTFEGDWRTSGWWTEQFAGSRNFQPSFAVRALGRHSATLESIHIDLRGRSPHKQPWQLWRDVFSFKDSSALKHLFINMDRSLWAGEEDYHLLVQLLPSSILSLSLAHTITSYLPFLESGLLGLADAVSGGQFQELKQVTWDMAETLDDEDTVISKFAAAGVAFEFGSWSQTKSTLGFGDYQPEPHPGFYCYGPDAFPAVYQPLPDPNDPDIDL